MSHLHISRCPRPDRLINTFSSIRQARQDASLTSGTMGIPAVCAAALIAGACEIIKTVVDNVFAYFVSIFYMFWFLFIFFLFLVQNP
jgi:hypothetical protein